MKLYNELSHQLEIDYDEPLCQRAKLDTGTHCNYRCELRSNFSPSFFAS